MKTVTAPRWSADLGPMTWDGSLVDLSQMFALGLAWHPDKVAVADRSTELTFAELEAAARNLARMFRYQYAVCRGSRVMVLAKKWPIVPAVAVALWKIGAIYMPVDPELPEARLADMARRAAPTLIVGFGPSPGWCRDYRDISQWRDFLQGFPADLPAQAPAPADIAYIIHTSGSTGRPKGVQITVENLSAYVHSHNAVLRFGAASRVLSFAPFHFDVSIEDTLLPLSVGAYVHLYNRPLIGQVMRRTLSEERITHLIAVSTVLGILSDSPDAIGEASLPDLQMLMTGAETCPPDVLNLWKTTHPNVRVFNVYGPTEVTIVCTTYEVTAPDLNRRTPYPIGRPLQGVSALLLAPDGAIVTRAGVPGELCLGGAQVMAGYLDDPKANADRIFEWDGERFYRSGDVCVYDPDGELVFSGRLDGEIKLNGRRISLGEIESECMMVPGVERAVVGLVSLRGKDVIGVVLVSDDSTAVSRARQHLALQLPTYARPTLWDRVPELRTSATGKVAASELLSNLSSSGSGKEHV